MTHSGISVARAENFFSTEIAYPSPEHPSITVHLQIDGPLKDSAPTLRDLTTRAIGIVEDAFGISFRDNFWLRFNVEPDFHNGLTTVVPTNRISVNTEAPVIESSIGLGGDYLLETIVHELGHMIAMQQRAGIFSVFDKIFGNTSRPIGAWPRWIHEGLAVWTEGKIGGRPASGYIDFDVKRYAEFYRRTGRDPFKNADLDGSHHIHEVSEGELPYHFGYLVLNDWFNQNAARPAPKAFVEESAKSLGLSFRTVFRERGKNLDDVFRHAQSTWRSHPLEIPKNSGRQVLRTAATITGPFGDGTPSWIESPTQRTDMDAPKLVAINHDGHYIESRWTLSYTLPLEDFWLPQKSWLVMYRKSPIDPFRSARNSVGIFNEHGDFRCRVDMPDRLREISYRAPVLSWIRSTEGGIYFAESATLDTTNCARGLTTLLAQSRTPFERLSNIYSDGQRWMLSRSDGRNSFREFINGSDVTLRDAHPLTRPRPAPALCADCVLAQALGPEYWGPVIVDKRHVRRAVLTTGSMRSVLGPRPATVLVNVHRWDDDQLVEIPASEFIAGPDRAEAVTVAAPATPPADAPVEVHPYSPWPSIWPHFWLPSMSVDVTGFLIMGQTFYQDVSERWSGSTTAGYDSGYRRPFVQTTLSRDHLPWGKFYRLHADANYYPVSPFGDVQDHWDAGVGIDAVAEILGTLRVTVSPELSYWQANAVASAQPKFSLTAYRLAVPSLYASVHSPHGHRPFEGLTRIPKSPAGFFYEQRTRFLNAFDTYQTVNFHFPIRSTEFQTTLEYGNTGQANFPAAYFQWGGLTLLSTQSETFLDRGFPPLFGPPVPEIVRAAFEWGGTVAKIDRSLSWNRFRVSHLDLRLIFESVTWKGYKNSLFDYSRYALGRQYFSSVGADFDLGGEAVHYVKYKVSFGLFRGFGPFGETRATITLRSFLDVL